MTSLLAPGEPAPFEILHPTQPGPWLLTCDHAANRIPASLGTLGVSEAERALHIGWDIGIAAVTRMLAAQLDAWAILQNYSRLVIDCNRPPGVPSSIAVRSENTDIPGNMNISVADAAARRHAIFDPYHASIEVALDAHAGQATYFVAMHSFTPVYHGTPRPMHAAVLYHRDPKLSRALLARLRAESGLIIGDNDPYSVSDESDYGIPVHAERRGLPCVEIEIRQDLIDTAPGQAQWAARLALLLPLAARDAGLETP